MKTTLTVQNLIQMITASIEVYPKESLGLLAGKTGENSVSIEYIVTLQSAKRSNFEVSFPSKKIQDELLEIMSNTLKDVEGVGDFHSHPQNSKYNPSKTDKNSMDELKVYPIVQIDKLIRNYRFRYSIKDKKVVRGNLNNFRFKIGIWYKCKNSFRLSEITLKK